MKILNLVKLKEVVNTLELLKDEYDELRLLIADQANDNEIEEATENLQKLKELKKAIEQMENLNVQIG